MYYTCIIRKKVWLRFGALLIAIVLFAQGLAVIQQNFISADDAEKEIAVPILMYHSIFDNAHAGEAYVISTQLFRQDMLYLKENGYTSIFIADLVNYVYEGTSLPEKPVIITFDDGFLNNLVNALSILKELDMKAVISVIGTNSENHSKTIDTNLSYAHLTWNDIKTLSDSGNIEIGNHTYDMHKNGERKGCRKKAGESTEQYQAALRDDLGKLQEVLKDNADVIPKVIAYPFGFYSKEGLPVLKELGFKAALTCEEKVNYISSNDPEKLFALGRFNRSGNTSTEVFMKKLMPEKKKGTA